MMVETQPYVEVEKDVILVQELIKKANKEKAEINQKHMERVAIFLETGPNTSIISHDEYIKNLEISAELAMQLERVKYMHKHYLFRIQYLRGRGKRNIERKEFVRCCPNEDCKGFLSQQWKCGLCNVKVCADCHEIKSRPNDTEEKEHTCDPNNVETAKLLKKDSKPCPKCGVYIFKIHGCNQMWCTNCHATFDWVTGRITTGIVHNPHYYEFMRQNNNGVVPRQVGDIECGGIPGAFEFLSHLNGLFIEKNNKPRINIYDSRKGVDYVTQEYKSLYTDINVIHRVHGHIQAVTIPQYAVEDNIADRNRDIRIRYMLNLLNEKDFKKTLYQREKKTNKDRDVSMILETYQSVVADILRTIYTSTTIPEVIDLYNRLKELRAYINQCMWKISNRYNNVCPIIEDNWGCITTSSIIYEDKKKNKQNIILVTEDGTESI